MVRNVKQSVDLLGALFIGRGDGSCDGSDACLIGAVVIIQFYSMEGRRATTGITFLDSYSSNDG